MTRTQTSILSILVLAVLAAMPAWAQPDLRVDFLYEAETEAEIQTPSLTHVLAVSTERSKPHLCVVYGNNQSGKQRNKENVVADVQIARDANTGNPSIQELRLRGMSRTAPFSCAKSSRRRSTRET